MKSKRKIMTIRHLFLPFLIITSLAAEASAQEFDKYFEDRTLRIDYTFSGNSEKQALYVDELVALPRWYGKRERLAEVPLKGNGQITVTDKAEGKVIFRHSFSTLFQEWLATEESKRTPRSFENTFLIPFPKKPVDITVELTDYPFFVGVQYHPEFKSRPNRPHPLFLGFIGAAIGYSGGQRPAAC